MCLNSGSRLPYEVILLDYGTREVLLSARFLTLENARKHVYGSMSETLATKTQLPTLSIPDKLFTWEKHLLCIFLIYRHSSDTPRPLRMLVFDLECQQQRYVFDLLRPIDRWMTEKEIADLVTLDKTLNESIQVLLCLIFGLDIGNHVFGFVKRSINPCLLNKTLDELTDSAAVQRLFKMKRGVLDRFYKAIN